MSLLGVEAIRFKVPIDTTTISLTPKVGLTRRY